jgi:hypothetical protein
MVGVYLRFGHSDGGSDLSHIERPGSSSIPFVMAEFMEYRPVGGPRLIGTRHAQETDQLIRLLIEKHHVSFHWGKNSDEIFEESDLAKLYGENLKEFRTQMQVLDPRGMFRTEFMERLLFND